MKEEIDRCFCFNVLFEEIEEKLKDEEFLTMDDIRKETRASCGCGLCLPYIEDMVENHNKKTSNSKEKGDEVH